MRVAFARRKAPCRLSSHFFPAVAQLRGNAQHLFVQQIDSAYLAEESSQNPPRKNPRTSDGLEFFESPWNFLAHCGGQNPLHHFRVRAVAVHSSPRRRARPRPRPGESFQPILHGLDGVKNFRPSIPKHAPRVSHAADFSYIGRHEAHRAGLSLSGAAEECDGIVDASKRQQ